MRWCHPITFIFFSIVLLTVSFIAGKIFKFNASPRPDEFKVEFFSCKHKRYPELTQDVPRVEETDHALIDLFIHAERRVENAKMVDVNTNNGAVDVYEEERENPL